MLSPIQLVEHKILRIHFDTRNIEGDSAPLVFRHAITVVKQDEQSPQWLVRLDVHFAPETDDANAPYIGEIAVVGVFSLPADFPQENETNMVHVNGGAILFGTVRELLSGITARGIHGSITLPTVDARCFLPDSALDEDKS